METKFTKGKWYINRWGNVVSDTEDVAYMPSLTPKEEKEANALLISKAPEMFEMLKETFNLTDKLQMPTEFEISMLRNKLHKLLKEATEL